MIRTLEQCFRFKDQAEAERKRTYISGQWAFLSMAILYVLVVAAGMNSWES